MTAAQHTDGQWADILAPALPAAGVDPTLVLLPTLLAVLLLLAFLVYRRRPRPRARRELRRLARALHRERLDPRAAGLGIRRCLRQGLGLARLQDLRLEAAAQREWQDYRERLTRCCFAAQRPASAELDDLLRQARRWLRTQWEGA